MAQKIVICSFYYELRKEKKRKEEDQQDKAKAQNPITTDDPNLPAKE